MTIALAVLSILFGLGVIAFVIRRFVRIEDEFDRAVGEAIREVVETDGAAGASGEPGSQEPQA